VEGKFTAEGDGDIKDDLLVGRARVGGDSRIDGFTSVSDGLTTSGNAQADVATIRGELNVDGLAVFGGITAGNLNVGVIAAFGCVFCEPLPIPDGGGGKPGRRLALREGRYIPEKVHKRRLSNPSSSYMFGTANNRIYELTGQRDFVGPYLTMVNPLYIVASPEADHNSHLALLIGGNMHVHEDFAVFNENQEDKLLSISSRQASVQGS
jgi:hypothetical protein